MTGGTYAGPAAIFPLTATKAKIVALFADLLSIAVDGRYVPLNQRDAITNLEIQTGRGVARPDQALAVIDDVVAGKFAMAEFATIHGIPEDWIRTTLGQITRALGTGRVRSLEPGDWYAFQGDKHPYEGAPGFVAAWNVYSDSRRSRPP